MYLHDVFIFSKLVNEHLERLQAVLGLLSQACISLKLQKRFFFENPIKYICHFIQHSILLAKQTDVICGLQHYTDLKDVVSSSPQLILKVCTEGLHANPQSWTGSWERSGLSTLEAWIKVKLRDSQPHNIYCCNH